jgi:hypothetical protein
LSALGVGVMAFPAIRNLRGGDRRAAWVTLVAAVLALLSDLAAPLVGSGPLGPGLEGVATSAGFFAGFGERAAASLDDPFSYALAPFDLLLLLIFFAHVFSISPVRSGRHGSSATTRSPVSCSTRTDPLRSRCGTVVANQRSVWLQKSRSRTGWDSASAPGSGTPTGRNSVGPALGEATDAPYRMSVERILRRIGDRNGGSEHRGAPETLRGGPQLSAVEGEDGTHGRSRARAG